MALLLQQQRYRGGSLVLKPIAKGTAIGLSIMLLLASVFTAAYISAGQYLDVEPKIIVQNNTVNNTRIEFIENATLIVEEPPHRDLERLTYSIDFGEWTGTLSPRITTTYSHPNNSLGGIQQRVELTKIQSSGVDLCEGSVLIYTDFFVVQRPEEPSVSYQNDFPQFPFTNLLLPSSTCGSRVVTSSEWNVTWYFELDGILGPENTLPNGTFVYDSWDVIETFTYRG